MDSFIECEHESSEYRARTKSNGVVVVCKQCLSCGHSCGEVPKATFDVPNLPKFDQSLVDRYLARKDAFYQRQKEKFLHEQRTRTGVWWQRYNTYLQSSHWRTVRSKVLTRDTVCQVCFSRSSQHAHHLTYASFKHLGISFAVECVGVCSECHDRIHARPEDLV